MQLHEGVEVQEQVQDHEAGINDSIEADEKANRQRKKYTRRSPGEAKPSGDYLSEQGFLSILDFRGLR